MFHCAMYVLKVGFFTRPSDKFAMAIHLFQPDCLFYGHRPGPRQTSTEWTALPRRARAYFQKLEAKI